MVKDAEAFLRAFQKRIVHNIRQLSYLLCRLRRKLQSFKSEVASSLNIDLKQGYNGDLSSREAGSIGGEMVKRMIAYAEKKLH